MARFRWTVVAQCALVAFAATLVSGCGVSDEECETRLLNAVADVDGIVSAEVTCADHGLTGASQTWDVTIDANDEEQAADIIRDILTALASDDAVRGDWRTPGWFNTTNHEQVYPTIVDPDLFDHGGGDEVDRVRDLWGITP